MKRIQFMVILALFMGGCATVNKMAVPTTISEKTIDLSRPGVERKVSTGDTMVEMGKIRFKKKVTAIANSDSPIGAPPGYTYPNVMAGDVFTCQFTTESGAYLCSKPGWNATVFGGATTNFNNYVFIDNTGNVLGISQGESGYVYNFTDPINNLFTYKIIEEPLIGSYKKELIYNGKSGNTIKILYREFLDSLARPAFFQNLEYDLAESKSIGFRDIKIKVIEATNSYIRFAVE